MLWSCASDRIAEAERIIGQATLSSVPDVVAGEALGSTDLMRAQPAKRAVSQEPTSPPSLW